CLCPTPAPYVTCTLSLHDALPIYVRHVFLVEACSVEFFHLHFFFRQGEFFSGSELHQFVVGYRVFGHHPFTEVFHIGALALLLRDRKSTRLNSSHLVISYAVFCLK